MKVKATQEIAKAAQEVAKAGGSRVKEKSIIISTELIPAVLDGTKTQTRRVIKPQPLNTIKQALDGHWHGVNYRDEPVIASKPYHCPYGQPGDRLWVKEILYRDKYYNGLRYFDDQLVKRDVIPTWKWKGDILPSIFMPRWASRILLEITRVRAERVQEISEIDAIKEGAAHFKTEQIYGHAPTQVFHAGWDSLNAKRGYGWNTNCWVWVIEFRRIE